MPLTIHEFALQLLVALAKDSTDEGCLNTARIPFDYRQRIENILCADNEWDKKFSCLIDVNDYFEDHFYWEKRLSREILNIAKQLNKELHFDLVNELISINFNSDEIDMVLKSHSDEDITKTMQHFASLFVDIIYSRAFQEEFVDYSARSRKKMYEWKRL